MKSVIYDNPILLNEWDFLSNKDKDIMEITTDSTDEASWICENCNSQYKGPIYTHTTNDCPNCNNKKRSNNYTNLTLSTLKLTTKNFLIELFFLILLLIIGNFVAFEFENFADTKILTNVILSIILGIIVLLNLMYLSICIENYYIQKNCEIINLRNTMYNLFKVCPNYDTLYYYYMETIEHRLIYLIHPERHSLELNDVMCFLKCSKRNSLLDLVEKADKEEFKLLLYMYRNKKNFNMLYSSFETKSLINFSNDKNISSIVLSFFTSFVSFSLTIFSYVTDWKFFINKLIILSIVIAIIVVGTFFLYPKYKRTIHNKIVFNMCFISSSIAKFIKSKNKI